MVFVADFDRWGVRVDDELKLRWDQRESAAEAQDRKSRDSSTWVPPILHQLVKEARKTRLRNFFPFMSLNRLCFSTGPVARGLVAPAWVALSPEGNYVVWSGHPYGDEKARVLVTRVASEAAESAASLLADWPTDDDCAGC